MKRKKEEIVNQKQTSYWSEVLRRAGMLRIVTREQAAQIVETYLADPEDMFVTNQTRQILAAWGSMKKAVLNA